MNDYFTYLVSTANKTHHEPMEGNILVSLPIHILDFHLCCFCFQGNAKYDTSRPKFHMGFPQRLKVCHKSKQSTNDMGAPTYWRLARLQTQMTSTKGTRDTTQEPQDGGQSIVVLSSILSGYSDETGARCNLVDGYYTDEEISLLAPGWFFGYIVLVTLFHFFDK